MLINTQDVPLNTKNLIFTINATSVGNELNANDNYKELLLPIRIQADMTITGWVLAGGIDLQLFSEFSGICGILMRAPPRPPHFLYVLPVTNSTEQSAFREVAYVYSWSVICPLLWSKNFQDAVQKSAARLHLDPTYSSPQLHTQFI